ncbi:MAG: hypothetical protein JXR97_11935 [Planctomycetes bacterium]|nr:hypothetical protein [Planctomycetota bacterium]
MNGMPFQLEPTFPLDRQEINRRIQLARLHDPLTWLIGTGALLLGIAGGSLATAVCIPAGIAGLWHYWNQTRKKTEAKVIGDMISENNRDQDKTLNAKMNSLRSSGFCTYATAFGKFILLKKRIESILHNDEELTLTDRNMDNLVDRISSLACNHFDNLCQIDERTGKAITGGDASISELEAERTRVLLQIQHAYGAMYRCLDTLTETPSPIERKVPADRAKVRTESLSRMGDAIRELEDETSLVRDAQDKVREDLEFDDVAVG